MQRPDLRAPARWGFPLVALAAALWGSDALFRRGLALELPAPTVVFYEHLILVAATLPLLLRGLAQARRTFGAKEWISVLLVGAGSSALATVLFTKAFSYGDPNTPLLLQKLQPLIAVGGAVLILGERLLPRFFLYLIGGLTGAYLIAFPDPGVPGLLKLIPALLAIGAAALWGLGTVLGRILTAKASPGEVTALRFMVGLPAGAAILLLTDGPSGFASASWSDAGALVLLALVPGLAALMVYYRGLKDTPAAAATIAELAFPVTAILVNYLAFRATLTATQAIGVIVLSFTILAMGWAGVRRTEAVGVRLAPTVKPSI